MAMTMRIWCFVLVLPSIVQGLECVTSALRDRDPFAVAERLVNDTCIVAINDDAGLNQADSDKKCASLYGGNLATGETDEKWQAMANLTSYVSGAIFIGMYQNNTNAVHDLGWFWKGLDKCIEVPRSFFVDRVYVNAGFQSRYETAGALSFTSATKTINFHDAPETTTIKQRICQFKITAYTKTGQFKKISEGYGKSLTDNLILSRSFNVKISECLWEYFENNACRAFGFNHLAGPGQRECRLYANIHANVKGTSEEIDAEAFLWLEDQ